ncbi:MAG TPA: hypothetical protein VJU54_04545, partial [Nitrospiraceae bacterium]|nr:hypothetical protein [Nitrospiraceae bacterium]
MLPCLSSYSTKIGYLQREFKLALDTLKEIPDDLIHTIPVRLESCTVPAQFEDLQWVNLFETNGFDRLLQTIHYGLVQRGEPVPIPLESP